MSILQICLVFFTLQIIYTVTVTGYTVNDRVRSTTWKQGDSSIHIAKNLFHEKSAYAICGDENNLQEIECSVRVAWRNNERCNVTLKAQGSDKRAEIDGVYGFSLNKVVLKWLETKEDIISNAKYTVIDITNCTDRFELSFPVDSPRSSLLNEIVKEWDPQFDIFISSKSACEGLDKCKLVYNYDGEPIGKPAPFNVNLKDVSIKYDYYRNYFVRGYDESTKTYQVLHFNETSEPKALLTIDQQNLQWTISRFLTKNNICYTSVDTKTVQCSAYKGDGRFVFNSSVHFSEPVDLLVTAVVRSDGMVLVTRKFHCIDEECWKFNVTLVYENRVDKSYEVHIDCSGDKNAFDVSINEGGRTLELSYACQKKDEKASDTNYAIVKEIVIPDVFTESFD